MTEEQTVYVKKGDRLVVSSRVLNGKLVCLEAGAEIEVTNEEEED